jgi:biopolymer transport protein TolQ
VNNAFIETIRESGFIGKLIILFLFSLSVYAWYIILDKVIYLKAAERNSQSFLRKFRAEKAKIFSQRFPAELGASCPFYNVYEAGVVELEQLLKSENPGLSTANLEEIENTLNRTISQETVSMEKLLIVLAITATISPLMGLLGTVWGIMTAFRGMAAAGNASIGSVAPGISEALVTTVIGLLVAIPALAGYNVLANKIKHFNVEMHNFASEFLSLIGKNFMRR